MSDQGERDARWTEMSDGSERGERSGATPPEAEDVKVAPIPDAKPAKAGAAKAPAGAAAAGSGDRAERSANDEQGEQAGQADRWEGELFDGAGPDADGAADPRYQAPTSNTATPAKPGRPSSGNWQMPAWMADEAAADAKLGGSTAPDVDEDRGRSRLALYGGVGLLVLGLLAAGAVYYVKQRDDDSGSGEEKGATTRGVQEPAVSLPADRPLRRFPGQPSKVLAQVTDAQAGLSYPRLAQPWQVPTKQNKLAVSGWSGQQILVTERNGGRIWYGQLLTGTLAPALRGSYDGPSSVRSVAALAAKDIEATYYQFPHKSSPLASQALPVGGRQGWLVASYLTYKRAGVRATGEVVATAVIDTGKPAPAVVFASVPNTHRKKWPDVNRFLSGLKPASRTGTT
ncbi:hypothetical protein Acsp04_04830 [Actinomadura sp. NBRC 104425]|uniref:hypothetical protein n=1 Tax=Actinomadura sp. NBRC 104425 TaxID=3032204 RepID=UPI0024A20F81|nr:hypothetical protein [Actinomadura sp. NBRC 104425]GLZ10248.1 hypothetical protein Acsp04_04830 [Actinomadura sp. NBRC 104425]